MFVVEGQKLKGNSFKWTYKDVEENVARFEYSISQVVCSYIVLAEESEGLYNQLDIYINN
jgi:hypothetical protein